MSIYSDVYRVVGFHVDAKSVHIDDLKFEGKTCSFPSKPRPQLVDPMSGTKLYFTYEVEWELSKISWASRWDTYLAMSDAQIHWFSIINSIVVIFFLSGENFTETFWKEYLLLLSAFRYTYNDYGENFTKRHC